MSALPILVLQQGPRVGLLAHQRGTWAGFRPSWDRSASTWWKRWFT